jgi:hypothetical protein
VVVPCCDTVAGWQRIVNKRCPCFWRLVAAIGAVLISALASASTSGQTREPITESRVRELARQAARDRRGDPTEIVLALDQRVRERWGDFESFPLTIVGGEDLLVTVTAPYMSFRNSLVDMLRSGRPIEGAMWTNMVLVAISPRRLGAADIESVGVSRNDRPVAPIRNALRPMRFSSGTGEEGVLHAGDVGFPPSAFAPGATVVMTLMPKGADPLIHRFTDDELSALK